MEYTLKLQDADLVMLGQALQLLNSQVQSVMANVQSQLVAQQPFETGETSNESL